jgi:hypothetical protein
MAEPTEQNRRPAFRVWTPLVVLSMGILAACATPQPATLPVTGNPDDLLIVDCLLPGQVRQLGTKVVYLSPRRPIKTSAARCEISGGEYVAFDRADAGTSLKIWLPQAESGDPQAQTYVGEIFEKGLGVEPDYQLAAQWYRKASIQGHTRASINLGYLYETGLGVEQNISEAMNFYRQASGIDDGTLEYVSTVEFARRETSQRDAVSLKSQVAELAKRLADTEARYESLKKQARTDKSTLKTLNEQIESKRQEIKLRYRDEDVGNTPAAAKTLLEIEVVKGQLLTESSQNKNLNAQLKANRTEIRSLRSGIVTDSEQIQQLKTQLAQQLSLINTLESELASTTNDNDRDQTLEAISSAKGSVSDIRQNVVDLRKNDNSVPDSVLASLSEAEERELALIAVLKKRSKSLSQLRRSLANSESQYQQQIGSLQSELSLSRSEQTRIAGRLANTELSMADAQAENQELRDRLRQQNIEVATREREQQRLSAQVTVLALSERATQSERRVADASTRVAVAELEIAKFEQSRLVTKLMEVQLDARQDSISVAEQLAILEKKLTIQTGLIANRNEQITLLENAVTSGRAQSQSIASEAVAQVVAIGPTIEIIEPPLLITRGPGELITSADGTVDLIGKVSPSEGLLMFSINGQRQSLNASGVFNFKSAPDLENIEITAIDVSGERSSVNFEVTQRISKAAPQLQTINSNLDDSEQYKDIDFGNYHAIVIGNNRYDDMSELGTAEVDARTIDSILRKKYGFSTQLLINATRAEILAAFNKAQETLSEEDNLIVYYAGHGQLDATDGRGYWLPVDANVNNSENWISNAVVTNYLDTIQAKQIMVIADSCFSGTLTKASIPRMQQDMPIALRTKWLSLMSKRKVRTVLSSGGIKPVYEGNAKHSLFAEAFISQLSGNKGVLEGHRLFSDVRNDVQISASSLGVDQVPQYAAIKHAGHEAGEFLFVAAR